MGITIGHICRRSGLNRRSFFQLLAFILPLVPISMTSAIPLPPLQPNLTGEAGTGGSDLIEAYESQASASTRSRLLGCQAVHRQGSLYVPCASGSEYRSRTQRRKA
jgi:ribosomal protein L36